MSKYKKIKRKSTTFAKLNFLYDRYPGFGAADRAGERTKKKGRKVPSSVKPIRLFLQRINHSHWHLRGSIRSRNQPLSFLCE